jgi:glyoxalase family protein
MHTAGIHHITAIASDPVRTLSFYTEVLGLRLVKRTVNFDDPGSYHLYFGDEIGRPGTIITFFLWPGARRGSRGSGQVATVRFAIAQDSLDSWKARLEENRINAEEIGSRFDDRVLRFSDPDGLMLELVAPSASSSTKAGAAQGIREFAAPILRVRRAPEIEKVLIEILGFEFVAEENGHRRFGANGNTAASFLDVAEADEHFGHIAVGSVHHIAFRAANESEQLRWREQLLGAGFAVSPVMDRCYFRSIYFREPNGILFEIATDGPGFTVDESSSALGQSLKLPPAYEPMRAEIERILPPLENEAFV